MPEEKVRQIPFIQSLDRGLTILQAVALSKQPVSLGELTELLGIDRSSAFRLANTLRRRGFLACPAGRKDYILGSSMWRLSHRYDWGNMLIRVANKQLKLLAAQINETAHLAIREGKYALFIDHAAANKRDFAAGGGGVTLSRLRAKWASWCRSTAPRMAKPCWRMRMNESCAPCLVPANCADTPRTA